MAMPTVRFRREDLQPGESLCAHCTAKCCRYFALPLETPEEWKDFDYIRWYLMHGEASVFTEDETWYLVVHAVCRHLQDDYRCGVYATRPAICREYSTDNCEFDDDWVYERYFETPEQIYEFAEALLGPRPAAEPLSGPRAPRGESLRSARPQLLPVIA